MGEPNPECKWCHGTGEIRLVVTTVPCDCTKDCKNECGDDGCKKGCGDQDDCIKLADEDEGKDTDGCGGCGGCYHV